MKKTASTQNPLPAKWHDDDPITLAEAAEVLLRGLVTASTLRAAADRGELQTERLGRRVVTTSAHIKDWRRRCRVSVEARTSTSSAAPTAKPPGTSEMESGASRQAIARAMFKTLEKREG